MIDAQGVLRHCGRIADKINNWENVLLTSELELTPADINQIKRKHPFDAKLQA